MIFFENFGLAILGFLGLPCVERVELYLQKKVFVLVPTMPNDMDTLANCLDV